MKLHLGCGTNKIVGWENFDSEIDLRQRLPWDDCSIDAIFTEHVIEHLTAREACAFVREAYRVLRKGGVMRTTFPNLSRVLRLVKEGAEYSDLFLELVNDRVVVEGLSQKEKILEHTIGMYDHKSLWTIELLVSVKDCAGFDFAAFAEVRKSCLGLENLERHGNIIGDGPNFIESSCVEAQK